MAQLNLAGIITRVVTDLKARFAAIAHNHAAGDITSGTLAIARGGTNAGTAASARTNLDAAQDASSGTTLYAAQQAISGLAAAQGSVPAGKTLQGEIQTLQDSVGRMGDVQTSFYQLGGGESTSIRYLSNIVVLFCSRINSGKSFVALTDYWAEGVTVIGTNTAGVTFEKSASSNSVTIKNSAFDALAVLMLSYRAY